MTPLDSKLPVLGFSTCDVELDPAWTPVAVPLAKTQNLVAIPSWIGRVPIY